MENFDNFFLDLNKFVFSILSKTENDSSFLIIDEVAVLVFKWQKGSSIICCFSIHQSDFVPQSILICPKLISYET
jgi:hypothetical protein